MEPAPIIAILIGMVFLLGSIVLLANPGETMLPDFDKLWDYQHPAETEKKFVELLPACRGGAGASRAAGEEPKGAGRMDHRGVRGVPGSGGTKRRCNEVRGGGV
jgi:hypothetical protein